MNATAVVGVIAAFSLWLVWRHRRTQSMAASTATPSAPDASVVTSNLRAA